MIRSANIKSQTGSLSDVFLVTKINTSLSKINGHTFGRIRSECKPNHNKFMDQNTGF